MLLDALTLPAFVKMTDPILNDCLSRDVVRKPETQYLDNKSL